MYDKVVEACYYLLHHYPGAQETLDYLNSRVNKESQELFKFGYFPPLQELGVLLDLVGKEELQRLKLLNVKEITDSLFPRTIMFSFFEHHSLVLPFRDSHGSAVGMVGRTLLSPKEMKEKDVAKYKNTRFKKGNYVFGLYENKEEILKQDWTYVVEGQFDVIKATERGLRNVVGIGNISMTAYQFSVISRYTNNLVLLLDNDEAGVKGRKFALEKFGAFANIQNFYIPKNYKDIDECLTQETAQIPSFTVEDNVV